MKGAIVRDLVKRFGSIVAVNGVSFNVEPGEALALLGPSGCGKTTVLRLIAGLEMPDEGEIIIGERVVFSKSKRIYIPPNKRNIGMVFQSYALWPHMTVYKNIAYPLEIRRWSRSDIDKRVKELLEMLGLSGLENRYPSQLSGGQQQRVALARAIAYPVDLLLLDEPLSNVDAKLRESLRIELRNLQRNLKITMIYVTHDRLEAFTIADRVGIMSHGKLVTIGNLQEIITNPNNTFVAEFLGYTKLFEGIVEEVIGSMARIRTSNGGRIICRNPRSAGIGQRVNIYVSNIKLEVWENIKYENRVRVQIRDIIDLGTLVEYQVDTQEGRIVVRLPPDVEKINRNSEAYMAFPAEGCYILKD